MEKDKLKKLTDEQIINKLRKRIKHKNVIKLEDYFKDLEVNKYFEELYIRYKNPVMKYCSKMIFDKDVLGDIFHDVFIRVYLNISHFKVKKSFKSWLYKIATNLCIDFINSYKKKEKSILNNKIGNDSEFELMDLVQDTEQLIEQIIFKKDIEKITNKIIDSLPSKNKAVFLLRVNSGFKFKEITNITNISERQVKTLYEKSLNYIANELRRNDIQLKDMVN